MGLVPENCPCTGQGDCKQSEVTYRATLREDIIIDLRVNSFVAALMDQILASAD